MCIRFVLAVSARATRESTRGKMDGVVGPRARGRDSLVIYKIKSLEYFSRTNPWLAAAEGLAVRQS